MVRVGSRCLNHPEVVQIIFPPSWLARDLDSFRTWVTTCAHRELWEGVVRVGSLCLNHPVLVHKHPTHVALSVVVC